MDEMYVCMYVSDARKVAYAHMYACMHLCVCDVCAGVYAMYVVHVICACLLACVHRCDVMHSCMFVVSCMHALMYVCNARICVYVCIDAGMFACVYVAYAGYCVVRNACNVIRACMCEYAYMHASMHASMHVMHVYLFVCVFCVPDCLCVCDVIWFNAARYVHAYTYVCMYVCMYMCDV